MMIKEFEIFIGKKVLLTGDTGFKGSWLAIWLIELGAEVYGYALPSDNNKNNFAICNLQNKIHHQDGDVRDLDKLTKYFQRIKPDFAIHMAAQALVLASYSDPVNNFETNLMGTVNFFEAVRKTPSVKVAINVTSDKCYENKELIWGYRETDPMGGKDPYSASKGCAELITSSYMHSFFNESETRIASVRAGNVIGGGDWSENRIIPDFFRSVNTNESLLIRNPISTRPWQFVLEPLRGYLTLISNLYEDKEHILTGGWNFGPADTNNLSVEQLIKVIINVLGKGNYKVHDQKEQYKKESTFLKLDISKAQALLSWKPCLNLQQTVQFTVDGYKSDLLGKGNIFEDRIKQIRAFTQIAIS